MRRRKGRGCCKSKPSEREENSASSSRHSRSNAGEAGQALRMGRQTQPPGGTFLLGPVPSILPAGENHRGGGVVRAEAWSDLRFSEMVLLGVRRGFGVIIFYVGGHFS